MAREVAGSAVGKSTTFDFALGVADFCDKLPSTMKRRHGAGQLFRALTAVAANYRSLLLLAVIATYFSIQH